MTEQQQIDKVELALPESNRGVSLVWLDRYAHVMDNLIKVPGTNFRFGLDPILGLIPVVGSVVGFLLSGILACYIIKYGASGRVIVKILGNLAIDLTIGSIPIVGFVFDFFYKSNERSMRLMREHYFEEKHKGSAMGPIVLFIGIVLLIAASVLVLAAFLFISLLTALGLSLGA